MPKAFPVEFRADVVAIARKREEPMRQITQDFQDLRVLSPLMDPPGRD